LALINTPVTLKISVTALIIAHAANEFTLKMVSVKPAANASILVAMATNNITLWVMFALSFLIIFVGFFEMLLTISFSMFSGIDS
jgi:hypothetical protein